MYPSEVHWHSCAPATKTVFTKIYDVPVEN